MYVFRSDTLHGKEPDREKLAAALGSHYPFPATVLRRCIELIVHMYDPRHSSTGLSPEAFLSGDRAGLTAAYVNANTDRLQILAPPTGGPSMDDEPDEVDEEVSLPPFVGPDAEERVAALLSSLGASAKTDD
jgi:hypothetical protein